MNVIDFSRLRSLRNTIIQNRTKSKSTGAWSLLKRSNLSASHARIANGKDEEDVDVDVEVEEEEEEEEEEDDDDDDDDK